MRRIVGSVVMGGVMLGMSAGGCDRARTRGAQEAGLPDREPAADATLAVPHTFDYLAQMNEIEIEAARSVLGDEQPAAVRELAQRVITDHRDLQQRVKQVADTLGVSADADAAGAEPIPVIGRIATDVEMLPKIDAENRAQLYLERTVAAHEAWIDMVRSLRETAEMPEVQATLSSILPVLEEHQQSAMNVLEQMQIRPVGGQDQE